MSTIQDSVYCVELVLIFYSDLVCLELKQLLYCKLMVRDSQGSVVKFYFAQNTHLEFFLFRWLVIKEVSRRSSNFVHLNFLSVVRHGESVWLPLSRAK